MQCECPKALLERLNLAAKAVDTRICMFILERRFPDDFGRRVYRKTNVVSENKNENVEITVTEADILGKQILAKFDLFLESHESQRIRFYSHRAPI